jgi:hypothetical protein
MAPKELFKEFSNVPENLYDDIVNSPEKAYQAVVEFGSDPTLATAAGVVTAIFAIMSLTNEVLPFLDRVAHKIAKKPIEAPLIVSEALVKLTLDKVKGIISLAKGLIKNPPKAILNFAKGIAKTPKRFVKNIVSFGGFGRRKARRQKRKLKNLRKQQENALEQEQIAQAKMEKIISEACIRCMQGAQVMWMIPHDMEGTTYATRLINDWKAHSAQDANAETFHSFLTKIEEGLDCGDLENVYALSPTAHSLELTAPPIASFALFALDLSTARLEVASVRLEQTMQKDQAVSLAIANATQELHQTNDALRHAIMTRFKVAI